ncbi:MULTISPECIES: hypothetical protein [unclassified Blautia]|uniref:hypothetical protein n=1 Tax=unclassified Blautia TaxID=2648079 RepID=UPI003F8BB203
MGGKVLELESERLKAEGKAIGRAEGETIGQARGDWTGSGRSSTWKFNYSIASGSENCHI